MLRLGPHSLTNRLVVAPMAGVTDRPFRRLCRGFGAGHAVSEMVASRPELWQTPKSMRRMNHEGEAAPIAVQIAGAEPGLLAEAARYNIMRGAQIIDINMGCPKKKVCKAEAGSALLRDEALVARLLEAVVAACAPHGVPVSLKIRTGWSPERRNALTVARIAEQAGIAALTVHGRTRACGFAPGTVEYGTIRAIKQAVSIPVIANGDIDSPAKAKAVLEYTGADAVMIGRAALGRPWIFRDTLHFLESGCVPAPPSAEELRAVLLQHLDEHYQLYGEWSGVRSARKHIAWYLGDWPDSASFLDRLYAIESSAEQYRAVDDFLRALSCPMHATALPDYPPCPSTLH